MAVKEFVVEHDRDGRFLSKIVQTDAGCWEWVGRWTSTKSGRYGTFWVGRANGGWVLAHRWSFARWNQPLRTGYEIDHECRNTLCVNPKHLRQMKHRKNVLIGEGVTAQNARRKLCKRGHPFDKKNTYLIAGGGRKCRACHNQRQLEYKQRKKA